MGRLNQATTLLALASLLLAGRCGGIKEAPSAAAKTAAAFHLDRGQAAADLSTWTQAPHPFGSPHQEQVLAWLEQRLAASGLAVSREEFTAAVPNPAALAASGPVAATLSRTGRNLYAYLPRSEKPCLTALATHTDTKDLAGANYVGANDSGSSSVLLVQLLSYLGRSEVREQLPCAVVGLFFDGEEAVLPDWDSGEQHHPAKQLDHTYGSRVSAASLKACGAGGKSWCFPAPVAALPLRAVILLDMVGPKQVQLSRDSLSSPQLIALADETAGELGKPSLLARRPTRIEDDHLPFLLRGVEAVDLIDFEHTEHWHRPSDQADQVDLGSMELVGQVALGMLLKLRP